MNRHEGIAQLLSNVAAERARALQDGRISADYAAIHDIIVGEFAPYKIGDFGVRNVLHDERIIELFEQRFGRSISKDTLTRAKKKLGKVLGFRWDRTLAGCVYRMNADGMMSGKYPMLSAEIAQSEIAAAERRLEAAEQEFELAKQELARAEALSRRLGGC